MSRWTDHVARWRDCTACPLHQQRDRIVLGRGQVPCDVLFIGEAPGASEDATGLAFWGPAGHVMDQIIERALPPGVTHALGNLVCCFPRDAKARGENEPEHSEIVACRPRLQEFIMIASPKLIVCVGALAEGYVHGDATLTKYTKCDIIHPAATFPGRMPRMQAGYAIQHAIVKLRCAVDNMLELQTEVTDASTERPPKVYDESDIPF